MFLTGIFIEQKFSHNKIENVSYRSITRIFLSIFSCFGMKILDQTPEKLRDVGIFGYSMG